MNMADFTVSWIDFAVVIVILVGVLRGRRRGMSEELMDVIKWLGIVAVAAYTYQPLGDFLAEQLPFGRLSCYLAVYITVIIAFKASFAFMRRQTGEKLVGSDVFGRAEYYLGMCAGAIRYTCVVIVVLAMLNARHYSAEEIRDDDNYQEKYYGSIRFPTLYSFQRQVFEGAWVGKLTREYTPFLLIQPTDPEGKALGQSGIARARQRDFNDALDKR
jgi:uncharacterized membrane protein required for colicin V production